MDELYVTTAWIEHHDKQAPFDGALFRIQTDVKGLPEPKFAG
jgi:sugar lactone lactonase YvrE